MNTTNALKRCLSIAAVAAGALSVGGCSQIAASAAMSLLPDYALDHAQSTPEPAFVAERLTELRREVPDLSAAQAERLAPAYRQERRDLLALRGSAHEKAGFEQRMANLARVPARSTPTEASVLRPEQFSSWRVQKLISAPGTVVLDAAQRVQLARIYEHEQLRLRDIDSRWREGRLDEPAALCEVEAAGLAAHASAKAVLSSDQRKRLAQSTERQAFMCAR
ncbi:hypothetical protein ACW5W8_22370 [Aeromonas aquatilis]